MEVWHDRKIDGGNKWYPEIQQAMNNAAVGILLISADFLASDFCVKEEVPSLLKLQEKQGMLLLPVLIRKCLWKSHRWLAERQMIPRDGKCIAVDFPGDHADGVYSDVAESVYFHFAKLAANPQTATQIPPAAQKLARSESAKIPLEASVPQPVVEQWPPLAPECVDISHLPETGAALFGREEELSFLDKTWASIDQKSPETARVLAFKAQGGVGKSTLINSWLSDVRRDHFRGASRVFGWSFYSQGVREQGTASADTFITAALKFFGDEAMANSANPAWDKGARLAYLVGSQRALLVLDGMEPLQSARRVDRGKLLDPGLESLLRGLARQSGGLCIITTREPLAELGKKVGIIERDLEGISPQASRSLLRSMHISGTDAELEQLAERFGPHALAITLLAVYLHEQPGRGIGPARELEKMPGEKPIDRVLAGFEKWLENSAELEALRLLGFFDRPADEGCLRALRAKSAITGLTERLTDITEADWLRILARLDKFRLLHARKDESGKHFVDTHPLIREHFAQNLKEKNPDAWRAGHRRLYEYLCETTKEGEEPTLEELQPLYQAVAHGCQAGLQQEVCYKLYLDRITRGNESYVIFKLGAFGSELGAVACFFDEPWKRISPALSETIQAWLLNQAAFLLRGLGRLAEALEPMRAGLEMRIKQENWVNAAISAGNLSELELTLGDLFEAVKNAKQSVTYADKSTDTFQRMVSRTTLADALHQAGHRSEADTLYHEAEQMQKERQKDYPLLYSSPGSRYCGLLLANAERAAWQTILQLKTQNLEHKAPIDSCHFASQRATQTLKWIINGKQSLLNIALNQLALGHATFYQSILEESEVKNSKFEIEQAVSGLRRSGNMHHLPRGLVTRAWLWFLLGAHTGPESAQSDLDEAWEIAERSSMKLFLADIHLYRARLFFRETHYPWKAAQEDLAAAEKLINECGYHRRDEELADAKKAILGG